MTTAKGLYELRTAPHAPRCTNAAVEAITGRMPDNLLIYGTSVLSELTAQGYTWKPLHLIPKTLRGLAKVAPTGTYLLATAGHALALVDGVLTDTEGRGYDLRRITCMFLVWKEN